MLNSARFLFFIAITQVFSNLTGQSSQIPKSKLSNELDPKIIIENVLSLKLMPFRYEFNSFIKREGLAKIDANKLLHNLKNEIVAEFLRKHLSLNDLNNNFFNNRILKSLPVDLKNKVKEIGQKYLPAATESLLLKAFEASRRDFYFHNVFLVNTYFELSKKAALTDKSQTNLINNAQSEMIDYLTMQQVFDYKKNVNSLCVTGLMLRAYSKFDQNPEFIGSLLIEHLNKQAQKQKIDLVFKKIEGDNENQYNFSGTIGSNKQTININRLDLSLIWNGFNAARQKLLVFARDLSKKEESKILSKILLDLTKEIAINKYEYSNKLIAKIVFKNLPDRFSPSKLYPIISWFWKTKESSKLAEKIKLVYHDFFNTNAYMVSKYFELIDNDQKLELANLLKCLKFQQTFETDENTREIINLLLKVKINSPANAKKDIVAKKANLEQPAKPAETESKITQEQVQKIKAKARALEEKVEEVTAQESVTRKNFERERKAHKAKLKRERKKRTLLKKQQEEAQKQVAEQQTRSRRAIQQQQRPQESIQSQTPPALQIQTIGTQTEVVEPAPEQLLNQPQTETSMTAGTESEKPVELSDEAKKEIEEKVGTEPSEEDEEAKKPEEVEVQKPEPEKNVDKQEPTPEQPDEPESPQETGKTSEITEATEEPSTGNKLPSSKQNIAPENIAPATEASAPAA